MAPRHTMAERHFISRVGWLRAAVLGANDGIISVASLVAGVAASPAGKTGVVMTGVAALVAGALSMAAGEYVSVSSQADSEAADLKREAGELAQNPAAEQAELKQLYVQRGLSPDLADAVARQLMAGDALAAHARDELGISEHTQARPIQAALTSALTFASGGLPPILVLWVTPRALALPVVTVFALALLAVLGAVGARTGGASAPRAVLRVTFWGALAMAVTAGVGRLFGAAV
ncbi:VIT1/CCC1 transporter family protein [Caulobacter sp. KR2-114]|uniref:VIT1/CCC1 transporter family protein n=1 Tax=Caulobacter sp. KR2-114 TaxID=3400912 RepID=UPI003C03827C